MQSENPKYYKNLGIEDLGGEVWKDVVGFEGMYMVSNLGRVKSLERQAKNTIPQKIKTKIRKQSESRYLYLTFTNGSKRSLMLVHILVAKAFIPNPQNKPQVNHKFGDKYDNRVSELEWMTASENKRHTYDVLGMKGTLNGYLGERHPTSTQVYCITNNKTYGSIREASRELNINHGRISESCSGHKPVNGFQFAYLNQKRGKKWNRNRKIKFNQQ